MKFNWSKHNTQDNFSAGIDLLDWALLAHLSLYGGYLLQIHILCFWAAMDIYSRPSPYRDERYSQ